MFQNLRVNSQLYILHKEQTPYLECGSVVNVSMPRAKYPSTPQMNPFQQVEMVVDVTVNVNGQTTNLQDPSTPQMNPFQQVEMVVDVTVNVNGQTTNLQGLPAGAEIADFGQNGNIVVACSRDAMNNEINTSQQKSIDIVNSRDYHQNLINAYDKIREMLNPEFAAKQQQDKEIADLRKQVSDMSKGMNDLMKMMQQIVGAGTQGQNSKTK